MTGLGIHAVVFIVVNTLLVAVWVMAGGDASQIPTYLTQLSQARQANFWPIYVMLFWGAALCIHAGVVAITLPKRLREQRQRRRARDNIHRTVLGILDGTMLEGAAIAAIRATDGDQAAKRVRKQVRKARVANERHAAERIRAQLQRSSSEDRPVETERRRRPRQDPDASPEPAGRRSRSRARPGRRWVAVMFTDIVDSTRINQQVGDEAWAALLADHRSGVRSCVARNGGTEVGTQGDGFLLRFDSPDAAVACATELQRAWANARIQGHATSDGSAPLPAVRIGIHAGEAVHDEDDLIGQVINLASRVTDVADEHEVLVTEPIADHLADEVKLVDRGLRTLKGFDRPRHLLAVVWQDSPEVVVLDHHERDRAAEHND